MSVVRKLFLSLLVILLIAAWLAAGIIAPEKIFEFTDSSENNEIRYQEMGAVDLTLIQSDNLFERMQLLASEKHNSVKDYIGETKSTENDINMEIIFFLEAMCAHAGVSMPETINIGSSIVPLLFIDEAANQSAIFWESCVYLPEENIAMIFTADDATGKIVGMYFEGLHGDDAYHAWSTDNLFPAIQQTLETTLGAESFSWSDNLADSEVDAGEKETFIDYYECTLTLQENDLFYHFPMCKTDWSIAFNTPHCNEWKLTYNKQEAEEIGYN